MILLDSDVIIDALRKYPPALDWFASIPEGERFVVSGFVAMELIQGCRTKVEQQTLQRLIAPFGIVWPSGEECNQSLVIFAAYRLSHGAGLLDALIGQTAVSLGIPLYTFNHKHYRFIPGIQMARPYAREG